MISENHIKNIEEANTGEVLFEAIAEAFESLGYASIGSQTSITPVEITQSDYDELPDPDLNNNIYLITDG